MSIQQIIGPDAYPKSAGWRVWVARSIEVVIGAVLLAAGLLKAYQPLDFIEQITDYRLIAAPALVKVIAWLMIAVECMLGAALIVGYRRRIMIPATAILFLIFLAAVGWAWATGATADCGCFGSWVERTPAQAFLEDVLLLLATCAAWLLTRYEPARFRSLRLGAVTMALMAGLIVTALASNSQRQSSDPARRLEAQSEQQHPFQTLAISDLSADVSQGFYLIALLDTGCDHCQASVPALNQLMARLDGAPPLVALCPNQAADVVGFQQKFGAQFPIGRISRDDFVRLFERGKPPRTFLLRNGAVVKIWDGQVPSEADIMALISP
jgi:hypothetical protein